MEPLWLLDPRYVMENTDETVSLISASKVQGTNVYNTDGDSLGEVYDVMIDKQSGKVAYAIMSFGGFLGVGEDYHPLPWNTLKYDTRQGGYVVGLTREQLESAPTYARTDTPAWGRSHLREKHSRLLRRSALLGLVPM
jgi:sporulation protein YlmC with PRC-barrel domain